MSTPERNPGFWHSVCRDYAAVFKRDPAVRSGLEILLAYPGFHAIVLHRINHLLWQWRIPLLPRLLSHIGRFLTGIEIHPGAQIGSGFFIDHGLGVVIGETAEIGENCLLYQGVTLGGTGKDKGKRHPTLGNNVVVGAGAKVLGPMRIGDYVKIGANSVVLIEVPDHAIVVGVPGRIVKKQVIQIGDEGIVGDSDAVRLPDPVDERIDEVRDQLARVEDRIERMEGRGGRMKIYNTMTGRKDDFVPLATGRVGMYACGVTVYDYCHIGHARSAIVFDVISRYFRYKGFQTTFVRNFTDIDDKIIRRAGETGVTWDAVARKYIDEYYRDMDALGIARADIEPKATEHISEMIDVVQTLIAKGHAYAVQEGENESVYFAVDTFGDYGKLSKKDLHDLQAGARVCVDERKKSPMDFALWKASKEGEPWWESPWGKGRPGWHIECTAMAMRHIGETIDIHGGGADLVFPHHENEIAQSEACTGKPFAKYWVHNGFITIDKEKMSKSLGNFFTIREILGVYDAEVVRLFVLSSHYRSPIEFSRDQLHDAESSIDRYYSTVARMDDVIALALEAKSAKMQPAAAAALENMLDRFRPQFEEAMDDDFNTAIAVGHIFELIREINRFVDTKPGGPEAAALLRKAKESLRTVGGTLNLFGRTPQQWNVALLCAKKIPLTEDGIQAKLKERRTARENKDWAAADAVRNELDVAGIVLEDKKDGTTWRVKIV
ncbi:MAG: cysteinyl-tRNA synthetase [Nitrospirae bacterium]|nr:MAG: cysteinyl-tRNA synthetase [Nitrospirota bacterium]